MKCPNDEALLVMSERSGIEIDYCPNCRGVWLDKGELDKLLNRGQKEQDNFREPLQTQEKRNHLQFEDDDEYGRSDHQKRKRGGFLGEIFDF